MTGTQASGQSRSTLIGLFLGVGAALMALGAAVALNPDLAMLLRGAPAAPRSMPGMDM